MSLRRISHLEIIWTIKQLHWPWTVDDKYHTLYKIDSFDKAKTAIDMIIEQGEGSDQFEVSRGT